MRATITFTLALVAACSAYHPLLASAPRRAARAPAVRCSARSPSRRSALLGGAATAAAAASGWAPARTYAAEAEVFRPAASSLAGTTVLITGANNGLGLESGKRLAAAGANVIVTARTEAKVAEAVAAVQAAAGGGAKVTGVPLDLASLASVRGLPARLQSAGVGTLDVLLNNAGVMAIPERLTTSDGFERQLGVNHLGHYALTAALLPSLRKAKGGFRIINVSSDAHRFASAEAIGGALEAELDPPGYSAWGNYGLSKAANVLFTTELQTRLDAAGERGSAVSLHPGVVQTELARYLISGTDAPLGAAGAAEMGGAQKLLLKGLSAFVLPVERGANTQVWLAAAADAGGDRTLNGGGFFDAMKRVKPTDAATDPLLAKRLWEVSEKLTGAKIDLAPAKP